MARIAITVPSPEKLKLSNGISPVKTSQTASSSIPMFLVILMSRLPWVEGGGDHRSRRTATLSLPERGRNGAGHCGLSPVPAPQLDVIAVRIADLGAVVLLLEDRAPDRLDPFSLQHLERAPHVVDLQRHHAVAQPQRRRRGLDRNARVAEQLDRRAAQIEVGEIERPGPARKRDALAQLHLEAENAGIELDAALELPGDDLDVVDFPEQGGLLPHALPCYSCQPILRSSDHGPPPRSATAYMIRPHISGYSYPGPVHPNLGRY